MSVTESGVKEAFMEIDVVLALNCVDKGDQQLRMVRSHGVLLPL